MLFHSHPDKQGREQRENISLKERYQQFYGIHKHHKNDGYRRNPKSFKNKYE